MDYDQIINKGIISQHYFQSMCFYYFPLLLNGIRWIKQNMKMMKMYQPEPASNEVKKN